MFRKLKEKAWQYKNSEISEFSLNQTIQSYLGYLSHANSYKLKDQIVSKLTLSKLTLDDFGSWFYTL